MEEEIIRALGPEWGLDAGLQYSREEVIALLAARIGHWLGGSSDAFFQLMYRLDIAEAKLAAAWASEDPPAAIAALIWERQLEKARSRARHSRPPAADDDLSW